MARRRNFPPALRAKQLEKGEVKTFATVDDVLGAIKWRDKRDVFMLSTEFPSIVEEENPRRRRAGLQVKRKPQMILKYNYGKAAVDQNDQLEDVYSIARPQRKCWKKILFYLINCAVTNAYVIYKIHNPRAEHAKFCVSLFLLSMNLCIMEKKGLEKRSSRKKTWIESANRVFWCESSESASRQKESTNRVNRVQGKWIGEWVNRIKCLDSHPLIKTCVPRRDPTESHISPMPKEIRTKPKAGHERSQVERIQSIPNAFRTIAETAPRTDTSCVSNKQPNIKALLRRTL